MTDYKTYLKTRHWQKTRAAAMKRANGKCQLCGSRQGLNVHHNSYNRRGRELAGDLIVLCDGCHDVFHEKLELAEKKESKNCYMVSPL